MTALEYALAGWRRTAAAPCQADPVEAGTALGLVGGMAGLGRISLPLCWRSW
jgi:hypothetical protein